MKEIVRKVGLNSASKRVLLGVIVTLLASLAWGAGARQPQAHGDLVRVTRGGKTALVAVVEVVPSARLILRVPDGRSSAAASGLFLREGGAEPVTVECALRRVRRSYTIRSCSGAAELVAFSAKLEEVPRLNLDAALDPSFKGLDSGVVQKSAEGDNCRAYCHYQWQWAILACWLWNPTGGCYDQVNLFWVACMAGCPL